MHTNGDPVRNAMLAACAILSACNSPMVPPRMVKSWLATWTSRPSTVP